MTQIFITKPGQNLNVSPFLSEKIDKATEFIKSIEDISKSNVCHICGKTEVSTEHTPSRKAFNAKDLILLKIAKPLSKFLAWEPHFIQGGNFVRSLCTSCNNITGAWYNPAYINFVRACAKESILKNANQNVRVKVCSYSQRIIKQGLVHLLSISQSGIVQRFPEMADLLLDREKRGVIDTFKIGIYIRANKGARSTGLAFAVNFEKESVDIVSEFSFWPIGWILAFDKESLQGTVDITHWLNDEYNDKREFEIEIPCRWAVLQYPKDFRTPDEIKEKKDK